MNVTSTGCKIADLKKISLQKLGLNGCCLSSGLLAQRDSVAPLIAVAAASCINSIADVIFIVVRTHCFAHAVVHLFSQEITF